MHKTDIIEKSELTVSLRRAAGNLRYTDVAVLVAENSKGLQKRNANSEKQEYKLKTLTLKKNSV